jgi:hypothetical protein
MLVNQKSLKAKGIKKNNRAKKIFSAERKGSIWRATVLKAPSAN